MVDTTAERYEHAHNHRSIHTIEHTAHLHTVGHTDSRYMYRSLYAYRLL